MRISSISLSLGRTVNLGDYNSMRVETGATMDIDEGDDLSAAKAALHDEVKAMLEEIGRATLARMTAKKQSAE